MVGDQTQLIKTTPGITQCADHTPDKKPSQWQGKISKDDMMKSVEQEKPTIKEILNHGLQAGLITEDEYKKGLACQTWDLLQPVLDKAQGLSSSQEEACERLRLAREASPLYRRDFNSEELKKLKAFAPEEYELLK